MMKLIFLIFVCASTSSAQFDYNSQQPVRVAPYYVPAASPNLEPIDFNDDIYNRDFWINPHSNIVYNFEQARRDQPLQIEQREENVGHYINRRPKTTTKPRIAVKNLFKDSSLQTNDWSNLQYTTQVSFPTTHLPATTQSPGLDNFSDSEEDDDEESWDGKSDFEPQHLTRQYIESTHHPQIFVAPTQPPTVKQRVNPTVRNGYMGHDFIRNRVKPNKPLAPFVPAFPTGQLQTTTAETTTEVSVVTYPSPVTPVRHRRPHKLRQRKANRGNHKFSYDDLVTSTPEIIVAPTTTGPNVVTQRGPPPPVPTLSSWFDGFGK